MFIHSSIHLSSVYLTPECGSHDLGLVRKQEQTGIQYSREHLGGRVNKAG